MQEEEERFGDSSFDLPVGARRRSSPGRVASRRGDWREGTTVVVVVDRGWERPFPVG